MNIYITQVGVGIRLRSSVITGAHVVVATVRNSPAEKCGMIIKGRVAQ